MDPNSAAEVATLTTNTSYPYLGSDPTEYTYPVYYTTPSTPSVPVYVNGLYSNVTSQSSMTRGGDGTEISLPIPMSVQPADGSDSQIIVQDLSTGDEWGFWEFVNGQDTVAGGAAAGASSFTITPSANSDGSAYADYWVGQTVTVGYGSADAEQATIASFPGNGNTIDFTAPLKNAHPAGDVVFGMSATNGYHYNDNWSGIPPSGFGSRGGGVPYLAGLVRPCEIAQGQIDHALAFAYQNTTSQFVSPATKSDGSSSSGMPEGAHLQLNPSISNATIESWGCTGACFDAAKALQTYGMYLIDSSSHPKVMFEDDSTANWGNTVSASTTNPIPLSDFRVIDG